MKSLILVFLFLSLCGSGSRGQAVPLDTISPALENSGMLVENRIDLDLSDIQYSILQTTDGKKVNLKARGIRINGDTLKSEEIRTRGQSTLMFRRKSLNVKLESKASFWHGNKQESLKDFLLLNLSMDKYYCRNRLAFEMMENLELFDLFYAFCELRINDCSEGVFLIMEKPEDWAIKQKKSPLVIRRGVDHSIDKFKADHQTDRSATREYLDNYKEIYRALGRYEGETLYRALQEYIDIDSYMKWLALNYLLRNGDYSDEVFFYIDPEINKFRIIPWDYDDIFAPTPHEGTRQREKMIGDRLIFSSEDLLDMKIATDPYLYEVYLERMKEVLETLSPDILKQVFDRTFAELFPYYADQEIIGNVQFDHFDDASLDNLRNYLTQIFYQLYGSRRNCMEYLESRNQ